MTSTGSGRCTSCDRQSWAGDRFCAGCGAELPGLDAATSLIDLDGGITQTPIPAKSSRRDSFIGIGALLTVIALVGLLFIAGGEPADDVTAIAEPAATPRTWRPTPTPTAEADDPTQETATESEDVATPRPTPTPRPSVDEQLSDFVTRTDMGEGWMVVRLSSRRVVAVELQTGYIVESGETIESQGEGALPSIPMNQAPQVEFVLTSGVLSGGVFDATRWSFTPWISSPSDVAKHLDVIRGRSIALFHDDDVGPILVTFDPSADGFIAQALLLGESKPIKLADPQNSLASAPYGAWGLQTPDDGFVADDGKAAYSWGWSDGWVKIADGQVSLVRDRHVIVNECDGPDQCVARLIDATGGALIEDFPSLFQGDSGYFPDSIHISPDHRSAARVAFSLAPNQPPTLQVINLSDGSILPLPQDSFNWFTVLGWSPNGRYLMTAGSSGLNAIDVETGATDTFKMSTQSGPDNAVAFLDHLDR